MIEIKMQKTGLNGPASSEQIEKTLEVLRQLGKKTQQSEHKPHPDEHKEYVEQALSALRALAGSKTQEKGDE